MKRLKFLSLLLTAVLILSLLPTVSFAASGTESDPIPLKVGEIVTIPAGTDAYFSFTPPKDGVYTLEGLGTVYASNPIESDVKTVYESAFFHGGFTYRFKMNGSVFDEKIHVLDEGRLYTQTTTFGRQEYLVWDFDPATGTLTIDKGVGDGEMVYCGEDLYPWDPIEAQIKHLVIGEGVVNVADDAFFGGVESNPVYTALRDVSFPSTLKSIGKNCFRHLPALKTVSFPAALESIDWESFAYCQNLESVTFEGPTAVGVCAFSGCSALADVTIKDPNMTEFDEHSFRDTAWVRSLAAENKGAAVVNNVLIGAYAAYDKKEGDGILVIPDGVKKIAPYALNGTTTDPAGGEEGTQVDWCLVEVVIPDSVTEIGKNAFAHCHNLERVTIGNGVTTIPHECFWDDYELRTVNFGKKVRVIGDYAFHDTWLPGDLVIPDSVVSIGKQAFHNDEISLGASWVEDDLFPNKTIRPKDLEDRHITMGPNLKEIGRNAFEGWKDGWEPTTVTIRGYEGTYAQQYAKEQNFLFESIGAAPSDPGTTDGFKDVPADAYYADAVNWALEKGITTGTSATTFSPNDVCTRAQIVTFLWRAAGEPKSSSTGVPFNDVKSGDYFSKAVLWAVDKDITTGTGNGTFSPNAACSRGQCVTFLWRAKDKPEAGSGTAFKEVPVDEYFTDAVAWAVENGVTTGLSTTSFGPNASCTRAQIVTFLYRAYH